MQKRVIDWFTKIDCTEEKPSKEYGFDSRGAKKY